METRDMLRRIRIQLLSMDGMVLREQSIDPYHIRDLGRHEFFKDQVTRALTGTAKLLIHLDNQDVDRQLNNIRCPDCKEIVQDLEVDDVNFTPGEPGCAPTLSFDLLCDCGCAIRVGYEVDLSDLV